MTIEPRPNGKYRIVEMRNGKRYRITVDHEPKKKEAKALIEAKILLDGQKPKESNTTLFKEAAANYIELKSNVLSPSSIRGYNIILRHLDEGFLNTPIESIDLPCIQLLVNTLATYQAPKTVRNTNAFIMSVLKFYGIEIQSPTLPPKKKKQDYIPSEEDIKRILAEVQGTQYEVPFILGTFGLRRSEICALTPEDLNGNTISINKALVLNENNEWVLKDTTKTEESNRTITVPDYVANLIRENGACPCTPHSLYWKLQRVQMSLGIPRFPFHKLRHFFASYMHDLGYSDKQIQEFGGWKTDAIMKTVYQHAMSMEEAKNSMSNNLGNLINIR